MCTLDIICCHSFRENCTDHGYYVFLQTDQFQAAAWPCTVGSLKIVSALATSVCIMAYIYCFLLFCFFLFLFFVLFARFRPGKDVVQRKRNRWLGVGQPVATRGGVEEEVSERVPPGHQGKTEVIKKRALDFNQNNHCGQGHAANLMQSLVNASRYYLHTLLYHLPQAFLHLPGVPPNDGEPRAQNLRDVKK